MGTTITAELEFGDQPIGHYDDASLGDMYSVELIRSRISAMCIIFVVSLFASSFPLLSKRLTFLKIPRIVFFIGKHFGTGVILSTAFVHLLQESFEALSNPILRSRSRIGDFTGLIVLTSLLSIFLIEYVSTSYVDRLQSYSSPLSSPESTTPIIASTPISATPTRRGDTPKPLESHASQSERSHLVHSYSSQSPRRTRSFSYGSTNQPHRHDSYFFEGHHRHESRCSHDTHHERGLKLSSSYGPEEFEQGTAAGSAHVHVRGLHPEHGHSHTLDSVIADGRLEDEPEEVKVGKKRQIVGILVLQLGIMIHSVVIGLTLAITQGSEFASLLVAIIFHQLFEGLSLGIRIASLPSSGDGINKYMAILRSTLIVLFAVTNPAGIVIGLLSFRRGHDVVDMLLIQGIMSAISAGMLMYAACVEMLAGDFVMDPILWRSGVWKQVLALASLGAGVVAMALVGM
ncbi:zinc iron permease [Suillus clintonianus]|uniref:zinc iron permease n=1 Tax=Suillus clintonianus TaxID=1904413 RepID=UPI001B8630CB|nr:zinc iron permease [Suillus clintonianus]KAG2121588.1 zinc iron permease [Suillus clintonianus]